MSVNIARSMCMKKIAIKEKHIQPAVTAGVTINHIFSLIIALLGGLVWSLFGFYYVFLIEVFIAALVYLATSHIQPSKLPVELSLLSLYAERDLISLQD
jgi:hypothetical protein